MAKNKSKAVGKQDVFFVVVDEDGNPLWSDSADGGSVSIFDRFKKARAAAMKASHDTPRKTYHVLSSVARIVTPIGETQVQESPIAS